MKNAIKLKRLRYRVGQEPLIESGESVGYLDPRFVRGVFPATSDNADDRIWRSDIRNAARSISAVYCQGGHVLLVVGDAEELKKKIDKALGR